MAKKPGKNTGGKGRAGTSAARLAAVQGLYEIEISGAPIDSILMDYLHNRWSGLAGHTSGEEIDRKKLADLVRGVIAKKSFYDEMIGNSLDRNRNIEGLDAILRAILRTAAHEMFSDPKVPARVVINEYVEIARDFYAENEPALVNGVLDKIAHVLRAEELGNRS
jgi:N utilization substance protein B